MHLTTLKRAPDDARALALRAVLGEVGFTSVILVGVAAGVGLLLDFIVLNLHPIFSVGLLLGSIPFSLYWALYRTIKMNGKFNPDYVRNLALASVAGQAGCVSVVLIFMALFAGMFLDSRLDTHPVFTLGLVLVSVPVSLYAMIRLMLSSVSAIKIAPPEGAARPSSSKAQTKKENGS
jgi:F0F1-type ATP synthase assembly protein I